MIDFGLIWDKNALNHIKESGWHDWQHYAGTSQPPEQYAPPIVADMEWHEEREQGRMNSCPGFGGTCGRQIAAYQSSHGLTKTSLSPMWTYIHAQMIDGRAGSDCGATIGAVRKSLVAGCLPEVDMPYTGKYYLPNDVQLAGMKSKAALLAVPTTAHIANYDDAIKWLQCFGPIVWGTQWLDSFDVSEKEVFDTWGTSSRGLHCYNLIGWSSRCDNQGRRYLRVRTSNVTKWGRNGVADFHPKLIDWLLQDRWTVAFGVTDRGPANPRPIGMLDYKFSRRRVKA
ncbi:hypothetical protein UFOVP1004_9 [uncultured Caudovirales phage]|uniref:Uncharacterized protein n=1 Tax=uncultured Caudovirales phage TaxID=2100421 RepID=A0A6J5Q5J0_9CAUD|nr:hypothetical protein UFOVP1004_9 [uncultured Caudovirales phage]